jgi:hypothetical protein
MRKPSVLLSGFGLLLICACTPAHYVADKGRHLIVGMDAATLKSCAGIPTRTDRLDPRTELYSYEIKYEYTVRRQIKRVRTGLCGREALAHLLSDVRRRFGGSSSVGSRWCVV